MHAMLGARKSINLQWKIFWFSIFISITASLSVVVLKDTVLSPNDFFVYYGTTGPFKVLNTESYVNNSNNLHNAWMDKARDQFKLGEPTAVFQAGDWIGWSADISVEKGVAMLSTITLFNTDSNIPISTDEYRLAITERRSGDIPVYYHTPANLPPGHYELRRRALFTPPHGIPVPQPFPSIAFTIVKKTSDRN